MAGGIGSRFWPMSRTNKPKQFLDILGTGRSLIRQTYDRFSPICEDERFLVVTSQEYAQLCLDHLPGLKPGQVLAEPGRKNTAPCIAYAAYKIAETDPDAVMIVTPADHIVAREGEFHEAMQKAVVQARSTDNLVTIGIKPTRPDTGYGYIQFNSVVSYADESVKKVKTFTEKPDVEMAEQFIKSGDFYWNSGMFVWKVKAIIDAFEKYLPDVAEIFAEGKGKFNTGQEQAFVERAYGHCQSISIDYGIMEKATNTDVVLADFGWSDLGTWGSLYTQLEKTKDENALSKNVLAYDVEDSIAQVPEGKIAVLQGLKDYIVIDTEDVLLICQKSEEQKIKQFVADVKKRPNGDNFL